MRFVYVIVTDPTDEKMVFVTLMIERLGIQRSVGTLRMYRDEVEAIEEATILSRPRQPYQDAPPQFFFRHPSRRHDQ